MRHQDGAFLSSHDSCLAIFPCVREAINESSGWSVPHSHDSCLAIFPCVRKL